MSRPVLDLYEGNNTTLYAGHKPANATQSNIKWTSSNINIAKRGIIKLWIFWKRQDSMKI